MKLKTPTVWEAMLCLYFIRVVDKGSAVQRPVTISFHTAVRVALETQSVFNAWWAINEEAVISSFASAHPFQLYKNRDGQLKVLGDWIDGLMWIVVLKAFFEDWNLWTRKALVVDVALNKKGGQDPSPRKLFLFMIKHVQGTLMNDLVYCYWNKNGTKWSPLRTCMISHLAKGCVCAGKQGASTAYDTHRCTIWLIEYFFKQMDEKMTANICLLYFYPNRRSPHKNVSRFRDFQSTKYSF